MPNVKVIGNFETFLESTNIPSSGQRFRNYGHWNLGKVSVLDRSNCPHKSEFYAYIQRKSGRTRNTRVIENFIDFLTMGKILNSDLKRRSCDQLNNIIRYNFFTSS
jgi:hypothetical protein